MPIPNVIVDTQPQARSITVVALPGGDGAPRKVTKLISLNDGGFSVLVPYHRAASGFLSKMPVEPNGRPSHEEGEWTRVDGFTAEAARSFHTTRMGSLSFQAKREEP